LRARRAFAQVAKGGEAAEEMTSRMPCGEREGDIFGILDNALQKGRGDKSYSKSGYVTRGSK